MAQPVSLLELRTRAQQLADMESSDFLSVSEWNGLVRDGVAELWDLLVQAAPPEFVASETQINFTAGLRLYALPADFRTLVGVFHQLGNNDRPLRPLLQEERGRATSPRSSGTLLVEYTPTPPLLSVDADTIDCVSGWDQLIIAHAARSALAKEESDTSVAQNIADRETLRIRNAGANRDRGQAKRIGNVDTQVEPYLMWSQGSAGELRYRLRGGNLELFAL